MAQPTAEPTIELILQDVETAIRGIVTTSSTQTYWHNITQVYRTMPGQNSIYPAVVIRFAGHNIEDALSSQNHSLNTEDLHLIVEGWFQGVDDVPKIQQRFVRDIRIALMIDPTRGFNGVHTFITGAEYEHSGDTANPTALVAVSITIRFRTRVDDLETAV